MVLHQGVVYFSATTPGQGAELWRTDGTVAGTQMVKDINAGASNSYPGALVSAGDKLFFSAYGATGYGCGSAMAPIWARCRCWI